MRLLLLHSNKLEFKATKKALKDIEISGEKEGKIGQCLVVFWTAEEADTNTEKIAENSFQEIKKVAEQVNEKTIVLYPYVHLLFGSKPASKEAQALAGRLKVATSTFVAIVFDKDKVRHIYFVAETKGSDSDMDLREIEKLKIHCATEHFKEISGNIVKFEKVSSYEKLMDIVQLK